MPIRKLAQAIWHALPPVLVMYALAFGGTISGLIYESLKIFSMALLALVVPLAARHARRPPAVIPLTGLLAVMAVSMLVSPSALGAWLVLLWAGVVIAVWLAEAVDAARLERALMAVFAALALVALYDVLDWWGRSGFALVPPIRPGSVLWNPNLVAPVMMIGMALALDTRRWVWLAVFGMVLVLTGSRATYLGTAAGAGVLAAMYLSRRGIGRVAPRLRLTRIHLLIGLGLAIPLIPLIALQVQNPTHGSLGLRVDLWRVAAITFLRHPLTGIGPERYRVAFLELARLQHDINHQHAHNLYLQVAAELGIAGLAALGGLIAAAVRRIWDAFRGGHRRGAPLAAALLAALLVHGLLDYVYWIMTPVLIVVWTGRVLIAPDLPESAPDPRRIAWGTVITAVLGFPALLLARYVDHWQGTLHQYATGMAFVLACVLYAVMRVAQRRRVDSVVYPLVGAQDTHTNP